MTYKPLISEGIRVRLTSLRHTVKLTTFPQTLRKVGHVAALVLVIVCLIMPAACSSSKKTVRKPGPSSLDSTLIGSGQEEVRQRFGEPSAVSKTPDDHILWVYQPKWKLIPNDKGTVYVEFEKDKVLKVFRTK